jgi:hypothetical protein
MLRVLQNLTYGPGTILGNLLVMRERASDFGLVQCPSKNHRESESALLNTIVRNPCKRWANHTRQPWGMGNTSVLMHQQQWYSLTCLFV